MTARLEVAIQIRLRQLLGTGDNGERCCVGGQAPTATGYGYPSSTPSPLSEARFIPWLSISHEQKNTDRIWLMCSCRERALWPSSSPSAIHPEDSRQTATSGRIFPGETEATLLLHYAFGGAWPEPLGACPSRQVSTVRPARLAIPLCLNPKQDAGTPIRPYAETSPLASITP